MVLFREIGVCPYFLFSVHFLFSQRARPAKYAGDIEHIIAKGQTPAGTHRPICVEEILSILDPKPGEICLDATLGYGGHSEKLLPRLLPGGKFFAVDVYPIELPKAEARLFQEGSRSRKQLFLCHRLL